MEFRILGTLEVEDEGRLLKLGGTRQRAVLALLLLHANDVVPRARLIDELWGGEPPDTARTALQVHGSQLRKLLGSDRIETRSPGYALRVEPGELDLERFQELVAQARRLEPAAAAGNLARPSICGKARLSPSSKATRSPGASGCASTSAPRRVEARIKADSGSAAMPNSAEPEQLVAEHPLRERLRGQLMLRCTCQGARRRHSRPTGRGSGCWQTSWASSLERS